MDAALQLVEQVSTSPWVYLVLFALTATDSFFPIVPGEAALVTVAVFAASGGSSLPAVILAGAAGACAGDHVAYVIGRYGAGPLARRAREGGRLRAGYDWAEAMLARRGGQALLASRYVPGVRTATTITMGAVRYPIRSFFLHDLLAASFWATGWSLVGYLGGAAFVEDPFAGLAFGLSLAFVLMLGTEVLRRLWQRRRRRKLPSEASAGADRALADCRAESKH